MQSIRTTKPQWSTLSSGLPKDFPVRWRDSATFPLHSQQQVQSELVLRRLWLFLSLASYLLLMKWLEMFCRVCLQNQKYWQNLRFPLHYVILKPCRDKLYYNKVSRLNTAKEIANFTIIFVFCKQTLQNIWNIVWNNTESDRCISLLGLYSL